MLMEMKRPAAAMTHFTETLKRTPGRPKAIYGIARAAEALGDKQTATKRYTEFLELWKNADKDHPEITAARRFLGMKAAPADDKKVGNQGTRSTGLVHLPKAAPGWTIKDIHGYPS